ncbi:MAG: hypothetical protein M1814_000769 [Vezdaea aestivalis]|nr:MAG: hypothetical protein M1814_000769 [Vezdaea aestivalis]
MIRTLPSTALCRASFRALSSSSKQFMKASPSRHIPGTKRPQLALSPYHARPTAVALMPFSTTQWKLKDKIDLKTEAAVRKEKLEAHPEAVSTTSTTGKALDMSKNDDDIDMMAGIKSDFRAIRETFDLSSVPREAYLIGLAGVLPYLATSASTFYLAWDINYAFLHGQGFLLSGEMAEKLLHLIEPIQVGYGAVIISFLGAIHWGLEFAGYGGKQGYRRYAYGVVAPAVAWPTIFFPVEYALITQFLAFTILYSTDAGATKKGWAPHWYGMYRFVLTFVVGASIVLSLIGRGNVTGLVGQANGPAQRFQEVIDDVKYERLEAEERARRAQSEDDEEAEEADEESEEAEEGGDNEE